MSERWKVSKTQEMLYGPSQHYGYGFSVQTFHGAPLLVVTYDNEKEALEAEATMRRIIEGAAYVTPLSQTK